MSLMEQSVAGAAREVVWLDDARRPDALPRLRGDRRTDLLIIGGGYTGLWTALHALHRDPGRRIVLLEAGRCGEQASGRNGGFVEPSLTHGHANGAARWPDDMATLDRLAAENLDGFESDVRAHGIDANFERVGELHVATRPHEVAELQEEHRERSAAGHRVRLLDEAETRALVASPTYLAGVLDPDVALVEPARLAWGLREALLAAGVEIFEGSPVTRLEAGRDGVRARTASAGGAGSVLADQVVLATNAFPPLLRRLRLWTVPVYDYVIATEPLDAAHREALGWQGRQGIGDSGNLFHYYRLTHDDRIVFGGYDAVYRYGSRISPRFEQQGRTHGVLARHLAETFPALEDVRLSHRWAGVIDTSTRFAAFYGTAHGGRTAYALGFTGLGVAATRFAGDVVLDLLAGEETERTALEMVRRRGVPFPPEPARSLGINLTRWSLERSDHGGGRRNAWLRALDAAGLGFDS